MATNVTPEHFIWNYAQNMRGGGKIDPPGKDN